MINHPNRKTIRLRNYDYSQSGLYFITICTQNRIHYFGEIVGATLRGRPNDPHTMIGSWLMELKNKYQDVTIGPYVIMPNHVHFILQKGAASGDTGDHSGDTGDHSGDTGDHSGDTGDHTGSPLRDVVGWFKTMTTNAYIRGVRNGLYEPFEKRLWQRNYYEHIIRNEQEYVSITEYIENNPSNWHEDSMNKQDEYA